MLRAISDFVSRAEQFYTISMRVESGWVWSKHCHKCSLYPVKLVVWLVGPEPTFLEDDTTIYPALFRMKCTLELIHWTDHECSISILSPLKLKNNLHIPQSRWWESWFFVAEFQWATYFLLIVASSMFTLTSFHPRCFMVFNNGV